MKYFFTLIIFILITTILTFAVAFALHYGLKFSIDESIKIGTLFSGLIAVGVNICIALSNQEANATIQKEQRKFNADIETLKIQSGIVVEARAKFHEVKLLLLKRAYDDEEFVPISQYVNGSVFEGNTCIDQKILNLIIILNENINTLTSYSEAYYLCADYLPENIQETIESEMKKTTTLTNQKSGFIYSDVTKFVFFKENPDDEYKAKLNTFCVEIESLTTSINDLICLMNESIDNARRILYHDLNDYRLKIKQTQNS